MERKPRKIVTLELFKLAVGMIESNKHVLSDLLDVSKKFRSNIYKMFINGDEFQKAKIKKKETWFQKPPIFLHQTRLFITSCPATER